MEMSVTTAATRHAKLHSNCHHQQTNTQFFRPDALPVAHPRQSTEGKSITLHGRDHPKLAAAAASFSSDHSSLERVPQRSPKEEPLIIAGVRFSQAGSPS